MIWQACNYWQLSQEAQQHHHTWCRKQPIHSASCPLSSQTQLPLPPDPPSPLLSVQIILHLQKKLQQQLHLLQQKTLAFGRSLREIAAEEQNSCQNWQRMRGLFSYPVIKPICNQGFFFLIILI
jgi:hypothetical protein